MKQICNEPHSITMSVTVSGGSTTDHNGFWSLPDSHPFKKLKVLSYTNLSYAYSSYPTITVGSTVNSRPAVGTEYNIANQVVGIRTTTTNGSWVQVGLTVELS